MQLKSLLLSVLIAVPAMVRAEGEWIGKSIPELTLKNPGGKPVPVDEVLGTNQLTIISVWAEWCPHCRAAMPYLNNIHQKFSPQGVRVVGINVDKPEDRAKADRYLTEIKPAFPSLFDAEDAVSTKFEAKGVPYTIVVDTAKKVRYFGHPKELSEAQIARIALKQDSAAFQRDDWPESSPQYWIRKGLELNDDSNAEARRYLSALEKDPNNVKAHLLLGMVYAEQGKLENSIKEIETVLKQGRDNNLMNIYLSSLYTKQGEKINDNSDRELDLYRKAIELHPGNTDAHYLAAVVQQINGRPAEAIKGYLRLLEVDPNSELGHTRLGELYMESDQRQLAIKHFEEIAKSNDDSKIHRNLAVLYEKEGRLKEAVQHQQIAMKSMDDRISKIERLLRELAK